MASDRERGEAPPGDDEELGLASRIRHELTLRMMREKLGGTDLDVTLDRFEIVRYVGGGGMGRIFEARDPKLDRRVAIKICRLAGADATRLLAHEARALAKLSHPNILGVHEVIEAEGELAIVMEYIEGRTLRSWVVEDRPAWPEILARLDDAGRALEAVHAAKLEHGDFKPDNVMIDREGRIRVVDFGVARSQRTEESSVRGTLMYMPPEQLLDKVVTARVDVFAYCLTIWELVFGSKPFTLAALLDSREPASLMEFRPPLTVPEGLVDVLRKGLAWDPRMRWRSIGEVRAAIAEVLHGHEWRRARWRRRAAIGAVVGLTATVVGLAGALVGQPAVSVPQATGPVTVDQLLALAEQEAAAPQGDPNAVLDFLERAKSRAKFDVHALRRVGDTASRLGKVLLANQHHDQVLACWTLATAVYFDLDDDLAVQRIDAEIEALLNRSVTQSRRSK